MCVVEIPAIGRNEPEMQALLEDEDPVVQRLASLRLHKRSGGQALARIEWLRSVATRRNGLLAFPLIYHKARTGRFAGCGFKIQNQRVIAALLGHAPDGRTTAKYYQHVAPETIKSPILKLRPTCEEGEKK